MKEVKAEEGEEKNMQKNITIILLKKLDNISEKKLFFKEYKKRKSIKWLKKNGKFINIFNKNNVFWINSSLESKDIPKYVLDFIIKSYKDLGYNYIKDIKICF
ncbi:MAG: hypothetical protein ACLR02_09770 [Clostridium sp.]